MKFVAEPTYQQGSNPTGPTVQAGSILSNESRRQKRFLSDPNNKNDG